MKLLSLLFILFSCASSKHIRGISSSDEFPIRKHPLYSQLIDSLSLDIAPLIADTKQERWIFHYRKINEEQYEKEKNSDGTISLNNESFLISAQNTAHTFYRSHEFNTTDVMGNGLYFNVDPFESSQYSSQDFPLMLLLKVPKGTKLVSLTSSNFLSEQSLSLVQKIMGKNYTFEKKYSLNNFREALPFKAYVILYDIYQRLGVSLLAYHFKESYFLNLNFTDGNFYNTAFNLIDRNLINSENFMIVTKENLSTYQQDLAISSISKVFASSRVLNLPLGEEAEAAGILDSILEAIPEKIINTLEEEEIDLIKKRYFYSKDELRLKRK